MAENTEPKEAQGAQSKEKKEKPKPTPLSIFKDFLDMVESVLISGFIVLLLFGFVLRPVKVDGSSMIPTLYDKDQLLMISLFYQPAYGDIIVVDGDYATLFADEAQTVTYEAEGTDINLIKRVIATEGQTINIDFNTGNISIDGKMLDQSFITLKPTRNDGAFTFPMTVPEGYCFVMGDNRNGSMDSRHPSVGLIAEEQVMGHVVLRYGREDEFCKEWKDRFAIYH